MQREVKLGLILGVVVLLILGIFWVSRSTETSLRPESVGTPPKRSDLSSVPTESPVLPSDFGAPKSDALDTLREAAGQLTGPAAEAVRSAPASSQTAQEGEKGVKTHKVQPKETLWSIAQQHYGDGKEFKRILEANKDRIKDPNVLPVGEELVLPPAPEKAPAARKETPLVVPGPETKASAAQRTHKVEKGETFMTIAEKYYGNRAEWKKLFEANKAQVADPKYLKEGQTIIIP